MYRSTFAFPVILCALVTLVMAQNEVVTLYGMRDVPSPSQTGRTLKDEISYLRQHIALDGGKIEATPFAVDPSGATYYVAVQAKTNRRVYRGVQVTIAPLPQPSFTTCESIPLSLLS